MARLWKNRILCLTGVVGLALCATASARDMVNILPNPGFETGMPEPWREFNVGNYKLVRNPGEAHSGQYYAEFAWRNPGRGWSTLENLTQIDVYPGATYEQGVWARGRGQFRFWLVELSKSGRFSGNAFGQWTRLSNEWQHCHRAWTCPEGIYRAVFFMEVSEGAVVDFDDAYFSYDREKFTPPEAETLEVVPAVKASDATFKLTLNGKPLDGPVKIIYGEQVVAIEAKATGATPSLSGSINFGDHEVKLDKRWRAAPMPADESWRKAGFDDRAWQPVTEQNGIWDTDGLKSIALRRAVLWKTQRMDPYQKNQWVVMMRDRMFVAPGSAGGFVIIVQEPSKTPSDRLTLHVEAPAFMMLLDRDEGAGFWHYNWRHEAMRTTEFRRDDLRYVHYELTYRIPKNAKWRTFAPLYFKAYRTVRASDKYTFSFWREANGNITDVPTVLPITLTGPVNGRQCKYFHLTYDGVPYAHSATMIPYSRAERYALAETLLDVGMNVIRANFAHKESGREYVRFLKKRNVHFWNGFNQGMNWPTNAGPARYEGLHSIPHQTLDKHPELQAVLYDGGKEAFEDNLGFAYKDHKGKRMWCQEYLAQGGKVYYDSFRPLFQDMKEKLGDILYVMWNWEYATFGWSCFCDRCRIAFGEFANVPGAVKLTDEEIVTKYPQQWIKFRLDQSARHQLSMMKFLKEYDMMLTNWHPGSAVTCGDFDYSLVGDAYEYHFMGWPGSSLPLLGSGRDGSPGDPWKKMNPDIHLAGQTIPDIYRSDIIDERMFKIWTLNVALGTHGGGWVMWIERAFNQSHGQSYFMGEATRLINDFEPFFQKSKHIEDKFEQQGLTGRANELIALEGPDGKEALVLLFNESDKPAEVTVTVKDAAPGWTKVRQWEGPTFPAANKVTLTVPEKDVIALHYRP